MWKKENKVKKLKLSRNIYHEMILRERERKRKQLRKIGEGRCVIV